MNARQHAPVARRSVALALVAAAAVATLASCTSARLVNVWQDRGYRQAPMRRVLIISQTQDAVTRRLWEDAVRARLTQQGVDAVASYEMFSGPPPSRGEMQDALRDRGFDGALVLKSLESTSDTRWVPGFSSLEPREYYNPWSNRSVIVYRERWHHGYSVTDSYAREQITLWTAQDGGRMVWAGTVEVPNPGSQDQFRRDLANGVVPGMKRAGLI